MESRQRENHGLHKNLSPIWEKRQTKVASAAAKETSLEKKFLIFNRNRSNRKYFRYNFFPYHNQAKCVTESEYKMASLFPRPQVRSTFPWYSYSFTHAKIMLRSRSRTRGLHDVFHDSAVQSILLLTQEINVQIKTI